MWRWRLSGLVLTAACAAMPACTQSEAEAPRHTHADIRLPADSELTPGHVGRGQTFGALLEANGITGSQLEAMLESLEGVFDPRRMREGQAWRIDRATTGDVRLLEYEIDGRSVLRITPRTDPAGEFTAEVVPYDVRITQVTVTGVIDAETPSLFGALAAAGESADLSVDLADIFSGEVDFNTDLQPGDRFQLLTQKAVRDGRLVG